MPRKKQWLITPERLETLCEDIWPGRPQMGVAELLGCPRGRVARFFKPAADPRNIAIGHRDLEMVVAVGHFRRKKLRSILHELDMILIRET